MKAFEDSVVRLHNQLVGWRTGIIKEIFEVPHLNGEPKIHGFACQTCDLSRLGRIGKSMTCGGAGLTPDKALLACFGEAVERYCCQFMNEDDLVCGSFNENPERCMDPLSLALYSNEQYRKPSFPFVPFTHETPVWWAEAHNLSTNQAVLVPACGIYMPYVNRDPEPPITPAISTGLSCGQSLEQATLSGLCEVIERDAFIMMWLKQVPTVEITDIPKDVREIFNDGPIQYHIYDLTSDTGIPVYMALSKGNSDHGELIAVGVAAGINPNDVLRKAFLENAQGRLCLMGLAVERPDWTPHEDFTNVLNFDDHAMVLTRRPEILNRLTFLGAKGKRPFIANQNQEIPDINTALSICIQRLKKLGLDVIVKDLTTEDIQSLGLHVVRVIIPGMHQLHGVHLLPFLGGKRLEKVADIFGVSNEQVLPPGQYNPIPHPLP